MYAWSNNYIYSKIMKDTLRTKKPQTLHFLKPNRAKHIHVYAYFHVEYNYFNNGHYLNSGCHVELLLK